MATTSSRRRSGHTEDRALKPKSKPTRGHNGTAKSAKTASRTAKATKRVAKSTAVAAKSHPGALSLTRKAALKAAKAVAKRGLRSGAAAAREAAESTVDLAREAAQRAGAARERAGRLPIQCSVDVAVPLRVVWEEWMALASLPEGVDLVEEIERDGEGRLLGHTCSAHQVEWEAEVLDQREQQSFAWRSHRGSDCAGLVTFHELSERLTRIELSLDVVPTSVAQALALSSRLADRRARADLRRFKARLELISPDLYEGDKAGAQDSGPDEGEDGPDQGEDQ